MVENSVKYYFYAVIVKLFADSSERIVIAEPSVYFFIIYGVVAVFRRFKDGTEISRYTTGPPSLIFGAPQKPRGYM